MKSKEYIEKWLSENLSTKRYNHSHGCAQTAQKLAKIYNLDEQKAYLTGLIHDCAKNFDDIKLLSIIKNDIKIGYNENELKNAKTYHAIVGAHFATKEFEINDLEILSAIRKHTIGSTDMSLFDKIIFLADKIEPYSRDEKYIQKIWDILDENKGIIGLNMALYVCFCETIKSLVKRKLYICSATIDVYNQLQEDVGYLLKD